MIILASALNIFIPLITLILVVVALLLILVVLMQRPKNEGLGSAFGGGMTDQMFGAQTTNVLQKATVWLGIIFFASTLILSVLQARNFTDRKITTGKDGEEEVSTEKTEDSSAIKKPSDILKGAGDAADSAINATKDAAGSAGDVIKDTGSGLMDGVKNAAQGAGEAADSAIDATKDAAGNAGEVIKETGTDLIEKSKKLVTPDGE